MKTLYEAVKTQISIRQFLENHPDRQIKRIGNKMLRVNPCPLCLHRDCFTIFEESLSFKCFSCEKSGDIICLEKYIKGFGSNFEAASSLRKTFQITVGGL